eukprot:SAG22_NODE_1456_length_4385_cov_12.667289_6_plen_233_part_00
MRFCPLVLWPVICEDCEQAPACYGLLAYTAAASAAAGVVPRWCGPCRCESLNPTYCCRPRCLCVFASEENTPLNRCWLISAGVCAEWLRRAHAHQTAVEIMPGDDRVVYYNAAAASDAWRAPPPVDDTAVTLPAAAETACKEPEMGQTCIYCGVGPDTNPNDSTQLQEHSHDMNARTRKRWQKKDGVPRKAHRIGNWWVGYGYVGQPYCQRCSEVFRDHLIRQKSNSANCSR